MYTKIESAKFNLWRNIRSKLGFVSQVPDNVYFNNECILSIDYDLLTAQTDMMEYLVECTTSGDYYYGNPVPEHELWIFNSLRLGVVGGTLDRVALKDPSGNIGAIWNGALVSDYENWSAGLPLYLSPGWSIGFRISAGHPADGAAYGVRRIVDV